jgi:hypothetical protein
MKKTGASGFLPQKRTFGLGGNRRTEIGRFQLLLVLAVFCCFTPLYGADIQRSPIDVNLIIDGSASLAGVQGEITSWLFRHLDQVLADGDMVTVWNAAAGTRLVYSGKMNGGADIEALKKSISDLSPSGNTVEYSGALREASNRQSSNISYTLLICASPAALTATLNGAQANLLRFSRVEEFSGWRSMVVGLNLDAKVRRAAAAFLGS